MMNKRILFVEDRDQLLELLVEIAHKRGYTADGVHDAKQAVEKLKQTQYHAIIIDASEDMPVEKYTCLSEMVKREFPSMMRIALIGQPEVARSGLSRERYDAILLKCYLGEQARCLYEIIELK